MTNRSNIWIRLHRKWIKLRLQPIRVFCMHHVCAEFDAESMNRADWMQIDEFKSRVISMQHNGVNFISLADAYRHICKDWIRGKKYAVLTFDDGYASLKEILPWLEEQHIPVTLFINGKYLDGKSYRKKPKEQYLTKVELFLHTSPLIEIGSHGWEHVDASVQGIDVFKECVRRNDDLLTSHPRYVPFYAYTYGHRTLQEDQFLHAIGQTPVLIDGQVNYNNKNNIQRELFS